MCWPGCQCFGFGAVPRPLAFATRMSLPSTRTPAGYQPTGILPINESAVDTLATPDVPADSVNTAIALLSASATKSLLPSGETASALGVLPSLEVAETESVNVVTTCSRFVSTTAILSVLPDATNRRLPSGLRVIADGCRPTRIRVPPSSVPFARGGNADTVQPFHAETYTSPSRPTTTP